MRRNTLRQPASIDENQCRLVLLNQVGQPAINFLPYFVGHHGFERRFRQLNGEVHLTAMAGIHDFAIGFSVFRDVFITNKKSGYFYDGLLRRRKSDALEWMAD